MPQPNATYPSDGPDGAAHVAEQIAAALRSGAFDPQHAGELFLRAAAEKAIRATLGQDTPVAVAGRDDARVRSESFMGARFSPDLVVETAPDSRVAVTITLLRSDAGPVGPALATALVLSGRYQAVVAFILDRRLARRDPFADPDEEPAARHLTEAERALLDRLWRQHRVRVEVRRQNPFGWD